MQIFPAIDLRGGRVVRLSQGDYSRMTVYSDDPLQIAQGFVRLGAACVHVVDLDGARDGSPKNRRVIEAICKLPLFTQVGGGLRTESDVKETLDLGVSRIILGTAAVENFPMVERLAARYAKKLAIGVDAKEGRVATHGWQQVSELDGVEFCKKVRDAGISTVIYTDIAKDGQLAGANLTVYEELKKIKDLQVIASGGVSFETELAKLREMGVDGVILGKALYTGKLSLVRSIAIAKGELKPC